MGHMAGWGEGEGGMQRKTMSQFVVCKTDTYLVKKRFGVAHQPAANSSSRYFVRINFW
jgi:hypothetical protein